MSHSLLIAFFIFATVMAFTPGPNNIMVLSSGLTFGLRPTLPHIAGIGIGVGFMVAAVGLGFGAIFVALLPPVIAILRDSIPDSMADAARASGIAAIGVVGELIGSFLKKPGVEAGIFGLILVLVILLEPLGIYGRWLKIRLFFSTFPMYKSATFKRQKSYMRSERLR